MEKFYNIFDSHAHYDDESFDNDCESLIGDLLDNKGVCGIVNNSVDLDSAQKLLELAEKFYNVYSTVGFHPENLIDVPKDYLYQMEQFLKNDKVVAIGEIGLDYHWDTPHDLQHKYFAEQMELAKALDVPVVIHNREAHGDTMDFLRKFKLKKCLIHCYSGSVEMLSELMKLGCYISLGGVVTFKNAVHPVEVAKVVPIDRLLLETDAPYMTPVPFRGKRCDSSHIIYTAQRIAEIRGIGVQELLNQTSQNAKEFYNIL